MTRDDVIQILKSYKRTVAIYESLLNEFDGYLGAQQISDMPKGSGISSPVDNAVHKFNNELKELYKDIKKVNIWLNYLTVEERFMIEQTYFEERFISHVINKWSSLGNEYHGPYYWKCKHKEAIKKITELKPNEYRFNTE